MRCLSRLRCSRLAPRFRRLSPRLALLAVPLLLASLFLALTLSYGLNEKWNIPKLVLPFSRLPKPFDFADVSTNNSLETRDSAQLTCHKVPRLKTLHWQPCYDGFQCARLEVPLDYTGHDLGSIDIALILLPATNPEAAQRGPLMIDPGGPGESGVTAVRRSGRSYQIITEGRDILGFDPRGVGNSVPKIDCFADPIPLTLSSNTSTVSTLPTNNTSASCRRNAWTATGLHLGLINGDNDEPLHGHLARTAALGQLCKLRDDEQGSRSLFKHAQTVNVVTDMLSILEAWSEHAMDPSDQVQIIRHKLNFWGFSWGSLLGTTFAALYPDRVGRIVVDGILNAENYMDYNWFSNIPESEAVWNSLAPFCYEANEKCSLYRPDDSPALIQIRIHTIMDSLEKSPVTLVDLATSSLFHVTLAWFKRQALQAVYDPVHGFPKIADWLNAIERAQSGEIVQAVPLPPLGPDLCAEDAGNSSGEAGYATSCSDKREPWNATVDDLRAIITAGKANLTFADVWLEEQMLNCHNWQVKSEAPRLPFPRNEQVTTSFPLLFLANSHDPVGPMSDAIHMAKYFKSSRLIEQESYGHCSTSTVSKCTINAVRAYFNEGVLPALPDFSEKQWPHCEADEAPWRPLELPVNMTGELESVKAWAELGWWHSLGRLWASGVRRQE